MALVNVPAPVLDNSLQRALLGLTQPITQGFQLGQQRQATQDLAQQLGLNIPFGTPQNIAQSIFANATRQQQPFTLGPGQERFGPGGQPIAQVPAAAAPRQRGVPFTTPEGKTVFIDPTTGQQIPTDLPPGSTSPLRPLTNIRVGDDKKVTNALTLRDQFSADQRVKGSRTAEDFFRTIDVAFKRSLTAKLLGPVDIALGKGFQKLTDIMSSVREGEFKTTFDGLSLLNKIQGKFEAITKGGLGFTQKDRKEIRDLSELFVIEQRKAFNEAMQEFSVTADEFGLNKRAILGGRKPFEITSQPGGDELSNIDRELAELRAQVSAPNQQQLPAQVPAQQSVIEQPPALPGGVDAVTGGPRIPLVNSKGAKFNVGLQSLGTALKRGMKVAPNSNIRTVQNTTQKDKQIKGLTVRPGQRIVSFDGGRTWQLIP